MAYRMDEKLGVIVFDYLTEDGAPGMQVIPMEVLANRMALLDLDDPGQALAAIAAEIDTGEGVEPYAPVVTALMSVPPVEVPAPAPASVQSSVAAFARSRLAPASTLAPPAVEDMAADDAVVATRAQAFALLDIPAGPEPVAYVGFKDSIRSNFGDRLRSMKTQFLVDMAGHA